MMINKDNYEAFFLDYHEGALSPEQVAELMLFVEHHPELKAELEGFEPISVNEFDDTAFFPGKENLKKQVCAENFDEMAIAFAEGTLRQELREQLLLFVKNNPSFSSRLEAYRKTILPPETITFAHKDALKKKAGTSLPDLQLSAEELLFISAVEGTLAPAQQKQLDLLLAQPHFSKAFALYQATRLTPDHVVFAGKESLKRRERNRVPLYYYITAAASVALLVGLFFLPGSTVKVKPGAEFSFSRSSQFHDVSPLPKKNDLLPVNNTNAYANTNPPRKKPVLVHDGQDDLQPKDEQNNSIIADQHHPDSLSHRVIAKNDGHSYNDINLVNTFDDPDEYPVRRRSDEDYLTLRQAVAYRVKSALLKDEMKDEATYREDKKKFTWYDAVLVLVKGVRGITGRDVEVKKKYDDNDQVIAYEFSAGKYSYTRPVSKKQD
jgi:hypothetical protein